MNTFKVEISALKTAGLAALDSEKRQFLPIALGLFKAALIAYPGVATVDVHETFLIVSGSISAEDIQRLDNRLVITTAT